MFKFWLVFVLVLVGCQSLPSAEPPRQDPLIGRIFEQGQERQQADVYAQVQQAEVIFLGETHDNPKHHQLQAEVIKRLVAQGKRPQIGFELFEAHQTAQLMAYIAYQPKDATQGEKAAARLRQQIGWSKHSEWEGYHDLLLLARKHQLDVAGLDLERPLKSRLTRLKPEQLSAAERARLPKLKSLGEPYRKLMVQAFTDGHCGWSDPDLMAGLYRVWMARNQTMAQNLIPMMDGKGPVVVILGNGHIEWNQALPARVAELRPQAKLFSLALLEVGLREQSLEQFFAPTEQDGQDFGPSFNWAWMTDRNSWEDPCQRFKKSLVKHQ